MKRALKTDLEYTPLVYENDARSLNFLSTSPLRGLALRGPSGGTCGGLNAVAGSGCSPQIGCDTGILIIPRVRTVETLFL